MLMKPSSSSWEERAFAEDAARILGGYVWPPRSYTCTFCKREFRSAQALGGHMNVHRRDRARLKQHTQQQQQQSIKRSSSDSSELILLNNDGRQEDDHHHSKNNYYIETDLSVGLLPPSSSSSTPEEEGLSCKRPKIVTNNISSTVVQLPAVFIHKPKMEDLDLELRLGKLPQKVK